MQYRRHPGRSCHTLPEKRSQCIEYASICRRSRKKRPYWPSSRPFHMTCTGWSLSYSFYCLAGRELRQSDQGENGCLRSVEVAVVDAVVAAAVVADVFPIDVLAAMRGLNRRRELQKIDRLRRKINCLVSSEKGAVKREGPDPSRT